MKEHVTLYIFTIILFMMGVIFGSFVIYSLSPSQKQELISYISNFLFGIGKNGLQGTKLAFKQIFFDNLKYLGIIWFLGLSIIGMPLIFLVIFLKGFLIGFTISFFISQLHWQGFLLSLVTIVPQNLLIVPVLIIAGVSGTLFSLSLMKGRGKNKALSSQQTFTSYSMLILILGGIIFFASLYEAYITPYLMKLISTYLIK